VSCFLAQEIGRDPDGVRGGLGHHQYLGRTGNHVDPDHAENLALGLGHVRVARADDLVDRHDGLGPISQRGDRLGPAHAIDLIHTGDVGGGKHQRVQDSIR